MSDVAERAEWTPNAPFKAKDDAFRVPAANATFGTMPTAMNSARPPSAASRGPAANVVSEPNASCGVRQDKSVWMAAAWNANRTRTQDATTLNAPSVLVTPPAVGGVRTTPSVRKGRSVLVMANALGVIRTYRTRVQRRCPCVT